MRSWLLGLLLLTLLGCGKNGAPTTNDRGLSNDPAISTFPVTENRPKATNSPSAEVPIYTYEVVNVWPHDTNAFTQGLVFLDGILLESTGLNGHSSLRKVELNTGKVLKQVEVAPEYFAEGLAVVGTNAFQLTWQNHKAFVYNLENFKVEKEFAYEGEGWGLATDGHLLILSDGTDQIRFLEPFTFEITRTIHVQYLGKPLGRLNELEFIKGEIFANVWGAEQAVKIDPANGKVTGVIDFTGLLPKEDRTLTADVLNGIAYDAKGDRLFVTGKLWPKLFEVRLRPR